MSAQKKLQEQHKKELVQALEHAKRGQREQSLTLLQKVCNEDPSNTAANFFFGIGLFEIGQFEASITYLEKANTLKPGWDDALSSLASAYNQTGQANKALEAIDKAIAANPNKAHSYSLKAVILNNLYKPEEGAYFARQALKIDPDFKQAYVNLGACLDAMGQSDEAISCFDKAVALDPNYAIAYRELGASCLLTGRNEKRMAELFDKARSATDKAVQLNPHDSIAHGNRASMYTHMGFLKEGLESYVASLKIDPNQPNTRSDYLMSLHYMDNIDRQFLFEEHLKWDEIHCAGINPRAKSSFRNDRNPDRTLKVGMVSAGFKAHPVGRMIIQCLENLDAIQIEIHAYANMPEDEYDDYSKRVDACCTSWTYVERMDDQEFAQRVMDDRIDIMFDLMGHSEGGTRLPVFASRIAPVQVKWVGGLFDTSGIKEMDWLLGDNVQTPPEHDKWYTEKIYRMPHDYICYDPPENVPDVGALPALKNGYITFGNLNHVAKSNDTSIRLWSKVLKAVPDSKMLLRTKGMEAEAVEKRVRDTFLSFGIEADRLIIEGGASHFEFMDTYNRIDVALDPYPYSGGLTTCEALWMGVPVITLPGDTFASRHAATHLVHAGLPDWLAEDEDGYVQMAVDRARDTERLAVLRTGLRDQVQGSTLVDGKLFATDFKAAIKEMWLNFLDN